jgi:methionyl-tRNA formyltransferase
MINNNKFFIKNIKCVVLIGWCPNIDEIIRINKFFNLKTLVLTSPNQKKLYKKNIKIKVFSKINSKIFKSYILKNCKIENTLFLSVSSMFIFDKKIIDFFKNNLINYFPSRLPYDQGRGGFSWHIMREDRILNNLFHVIDTGINTGPIITNKKSLFPSNCKIPLDFENYKWSEMNIFYNDFLRDLKKGLEFKISHQPNYLGRYNPSLNTLKNGFIDWTLNSYDLFSFINAFDEPFKGASTFLNQKKFGRLFIKKVHLHGGDTANHPFQAGIISRHDKEWITVCTSGKHMLLIEEVKNSKEQNILKFLKEGDRFFTPIKFLENSKLDSVNYKA